MLVLLHRGADGFTHFMIPGEHQVISIHFRSFSILYCLISLFVRKQLCLNARYIFLSHGLQVLVSTQPTFLNSLTAQIACERYTCICDTPISRCHIQIWDVHMHYTQYTAVLLPSLPEDGVGTGLRKVSIMCETLMAASTHTMGVSVSTNGPLHQQSRPQIQHVGSLGTEKLLIHIQQDVQLCIQYIWLISNTHQTLSHHWVSSSQTTPLLGTNIPICGGQRKMKSTLWVDAH